LSFKQISTICDMLFDIIFILIFCWAAYKGFTRGFILQAASLIALILGVYGAIKFSGYISAVIMEKMDSHGQYLPLISFAITFLGIVIATHFLARLLEKLLEFIALSFVNRIFGVLFNIAKYAFIISCLLVVINGFNRRTHFIPKEKINESHLYIPLSIIAPLIFPYLHFDFTHPLDVPVRPKDEILV
jgi:membrane protein required for colicin V production